MYFHSSSLIFPQATINVCLDKLFLHTKYINDCHWPGARSPVSYRYNGNNK